MPHVPWYRRKDYRRIRSIMDDGDKSKTFDEWERTAKRRLASAAAAGVTIEPVILDPGEFLVYCKAKNFSERGDRERNMFAREAMLGADFQW
jgi:dihydropteroate synthase